MTFNQEQTEAVHHAEGPLLVLAGPGSGKTAVITARTAYLSETYKVSPSSILVVTFTKAAAGQMKERFLRMRGAVHTNVHFGTFHGLFFGILKQAYGLSGRNIISEEEKKRILRELLAGSGLEAEDERDVLELLQREISMVKTEQMPLDHFYSGSCPEETFRQIYRKYHEILCGKKLLDFDDLMVYCYELFIKRPDILKKWQEHFQYIQIDEFQDINMLQYRIIRMLAAPQNNLFAVGDDDQSIYRFRGAKPEMMFRFQKDYPSGKTIILHQNYRCSASIVKCSQRLIRHNSARFEKQLTTSNTAGKAVEMCTFPDENAETDYLLESIRKLIENGGACEDIAVLFRTNMGSRPTVSRLMEYNLPFTVKDGLPNIFEHWIAVHILSYLRLSKGGRQRSDFLQIANKPNRYISREALYESEVSFEHLYQFYEGKDWMCDRIEKLEEDLKILAGMPPFAAINYIRCGIGYNEYIREYAGYRKMKPEELNDVMDELQQSARKYRTFEEWCTYIQDYTLELRKQKSKKQEGGITISTLHGAKGLEYPHVYIMDINEGTIPYHKAVLPEEVEEERRLLYVGMTRASETLHLFSTKKKYEKKQEPSRFLEEMMRENETCVTK